MSLRGMSPLSKTRRQSQWQQGWHSPSAIEPAPRRPRRSRAAAEPAGGGATKKRGRREKAVRRALSRAAKGLKEHPGGGVPVRHPVETAIGTLSGALAAMTRILTRRFLRVALAKLFDSPGCAILGL
jgi:hypothetical protein